tara:strand:- start:2100 stop:10340 length:8241 start_codon:yes stop_codon:yes gene_type:complete
MNKDLDERLVPKNEYLEALNVDVSSTEDSDVGAIQNSYGNLLKSTTGIVGATCVGSVLYPNNSIGSTSIIWFIAGDNANAIVEYLPDQQITLPILIDVFRVKTNVNGGMGALDDTFAVDNTNGLFNNIRIGMESVTSIDSPGNYPKVRVKNISTTHAHGPQAGNTTQIVTMSSPNGNIRVGQTVSGAGITNNVTVSSVVGNQIVLSGVPGGTIPSNVQLTFTSTNTITLDDYRSYPDDTIVEFVDEGFLKFDSSKKITGINVLDGLLFWTDGVNEPKKINIETMKSGCQTTAARYFDRTTVLKINGLKKADTVTEKDITVIKKYPLNAPSLDLREDTREGKITASLTTPANTSYAASGAVHARGSGNKVIYNKTFERTLYKQSEINTRVLRFDSTVSGTVNIMGDGIHYKDWRSVAPGMTVVVDGTVLTDSTHGGNPVLFVDYENHCVYLKYKLEELIESNATIQFRYWLDVYQNESFWTYKTEGARVVPKPPGTNNLIQTGLDDGETNNVGSIGRPVRIQELQFDGQPNFLAGDIVKLIAPNPNAGSNEEPDVTVKVKLLDEIIGTTSLMEPATHAKAIASPGSERISNSSNRDFTGAGDWQLFTRGLNQGLANANLVTLDTSNGRIRFDSDDLDTKALYAILPKDKISPTTDSFIANQTYQIIAKLDMDQYVEGSLRAQITTGGESGRTLSSLDNRAKGYDFCLETTAIVNGNPSAGATSIALKHQNAGIEVGMKVRNEDAYVGDVSAISGANLTLTNVQNNYDLADGDLLTFHQKSGLKTITFYLHTPSEFSSNGVTVNPCQFKALADSPRRWPTALSGANVRALKLEQATGVSGAPQTKSHLTNAVTVGMKITGTNVPADTYVMQRRQDRIFCNNDVSGVADGTELTFTASFMLKALHSHFNDSDIDLTFNDISIKNCTPDIGNGFGFQGTNTFGGFSRKVFNAEIQTITNNITQLNTSNPINWSCSLIDRDPIFEDKFPRFAYRWMFADGEYSAISPFSKIAFLPNSKNGFDYDGQSGFNVSMQNNLRRLTLTGFDNMPLDVTEFQLLYKESDSNNIYHYASKRGGDLAFDQIEITSETVNAVLPSEQLLRPYDNVPKSALAQEISANRLIYANYKQQYDMVGYNNDNAKFDYVFKKVANNIVDNKPKETMKSFRSYDLGVSLLDKYGRQTPVFSNDNRQIKLGNEDAKQSNVFEALVSSQPEEWATHYKYFIHDKHNDHYNVALDRFYPAETSEHVWLSFVSSDANKIQEDDFLILKKVHDSNEAVPGNKTVKYKVLEKVNEAPESITGVKKLIGRIADVDFGRISEPAVNFPVAGSNIVRLRGSSVIGTDLEEIYNLDQGNKYIRIGNSDQVVISNYYRVSSIERFDDNTDGDFADTDDYYDIILESTIGGDTNFVGTSSAQTNNCFIEYYEKVVDEFADEFEGKFFVKILKDANLNEYILSKSTPKDEVYYTLKYTKDVKWIHVWNEGTDNLGNYHSTGGTDIDEVKADSNTWMLDTYSWSQVYTGGSESVNLLDPAFPLREYEYENALKPIYHTPEDLNLRGTVTSSDYGSDQFMAIDSAWSYGASGVLNHGDDYGAGDHAKAGYGFRIGENRCQFRLTNVGNNTTGVNDVVLSNPSSSDISSELNSLYNDLATVGTMFRWADDPDKTVYTINAVNTHGVHQHRHSEKAQRSYKDDDTTSSTGVLQVADYSGAGGSVPNYDGTVDWEFVGGPAGNTQPAISLGTLYTTNQTARAITAGAAVKNNAGNYLVNSSGNKCRVIHATSPGSNSSPLTYASVTWPGNFPVAVYYAVLDSEPTNGRPSPGDNVEFFRSPSYIDANSNLISNDFDVQNSDASDFSNKDNMGWRFDIELNKTITWSPTSKLNQDGSTNSDNIRPLGPTYPSTNLTADSRKIEIVKIDTDPIGETFFSENPAIFEVEPPKAIDTNLYYETANSDIIIKPGMYVSCADVIGQSSTYNPLSPDAVISVVNYESNVLTNGPGQPGTSALNIKIDGIEDTIPSGHKITIFSKDENDNVDLTQEFTVLVGNSVSQTDSVGNKNQLDYTPRANDSTFFNGVKIRPTKLEYFNCYSYGNGVESNRIRDDFNALTIDKGPRVSTTMLNKYMEEHRRHGFIYSGIYNNISTENNLNQFIQANKITKDLNPIYGSIQKLFSRNTNLVTFCENKVLKVLSNKDALFNADGNVNVTSTNAVLGQAIPFAGDFGISRNPESFANYGYRIYFSDKDRNAILRLSGDGITDISEKGMKKFFKDNLNEASLVIGSYDVNKDLYNITLNNKTASFSEAVNGWTSLKSFLPENGLSISGDFYTFYNGEIWKHTVNTLRSNFYGVQYDSQVKLVLNDEPSIVKNYKSLNYEGTKSRKYNDSGNLSGSGWYSDSIQTDLQSGEVKQFVDKENKWFNYIKGETLTTQNLDSKEFSVQGLGVCSVVAVSSGTHNTQYQHNIKMLPSSENVPLTLAGATYGYIDSGGVAADFAASSSAGSINPATIGGTNDAAGFTVNSSTQITGTIIANNANSIPSGVRFLRGVVTDLVPGQTYTISATVSGYTKGSGGTSANMHEIGFSDISGVGTTARRSSNGEISTTFVAIGKRIDIFKGAYVAAVLSNMSIVKVNTELYPKFIINKSLTDLTTADTSITVNRSSGSISSENQYFYVHGKSVSGQRWNQVASGVTITEVSDPSNNIGTVVKEDGYISDGSFVASTLYQNTATNVIRLTVPVSGTMPGNNLTCVLSANITSNLVQS